MKISIHTDHTLIIDELEKSIKFHNLSFILVYLPKGSYLVGGYLRDIILGRETEEVDVDIVVPLNSTIKLLQRSLSNFLINNLSDSRLFFFLYPKPKESFVLFIANEG